MSVTSKDQDLTNESLSNAWLNDFWLIINLLFIKIRASLRKKSGFPVKIAQSQHGTLCNTAHCNNSKVSPTHLGLGKQQAEPNNEHDDAQQ